MMKKRRIFSAILAGLMTCSLAFGTVNMEAKASTNEDICVDGSYLTDDESSEGIIEVMTWGNYLKSGSSHISKAGTGKVTVSGSTVGQRVVSSIKVSVRLQKLVDGAWQAYRFWSATDTNSAYVDLEKTLTVDRGYYYRVYSTHTAGGETSSSSTNGIYIN